MILRPLYVVAGLTCALCLSLDMSLWRALPCSCLCSFNLNAALFYAVYEPEINATAAQRRNGYYTAIGLVAMAGAVFLCFLKL